MTDIRTKLAYAYQILGYLDLDDHTYTHLSARAEDGNSYYIYPFGLRFEELSFLSRFLLEVLAIYY